MLAAVGAVPHSLRVTKEGFPEHPLYLPSGSKLNRYELP